MLWQKYNENHKHPHIGDKLESTDAAPKVPHPHPTRRDAGRGVRRGCPRVGPRLRLFYFIFFSWIRADSAQFAPMRLDSCRIGFDSRRIGLIRPKSGRIGHIGTYRPAADTADTTETGRKTAETGRNGRKQAETGQKRPKSALSMAVKSETCILLSFFVNQGIVCVF